MHNVSNKLYPDAFSFLKSKGDQCCGCAACAQACPSQALSMIDNEKGFLEPHINLGKCSHCGLCIKYCPIISCESKNSKNPIIFAYSGPKELLNLSSSGGAFSILANYIINKNGIVIGAAYRSNFSIHHIAVDNIKDIDKLRLSKYVQSDQENSYQTVRDFLKTKKMVLYTGTPCQIAGLYKFLNKIDLTNLLTVDLLCHGVPSYLVLKKFLEENFGIINIDKIYMRSRENWATCLDIHLKNNDIFQTKKYSPFILSFLKDLSLRDSCYSCRFATIPRQGDITLGDFWDAKKYNLGLPYEKKSSIVIINNDKGSKLWELSRKNIFNDQCMQMKGFNFKNFNKNIYAPNAKKTPMVESFWSMFYDNSLAYTTLKSISKASVGLIFFASDNYGSCATNVALYKVIELLGFSPIVLDSLVPPAGISSEYMKKYIKMSGGIIGKDDYKMANILCNSFVVGSDYSMNVKALKTRNYIEYFLMAFAKSDKRKIAYGPSLGMPPVKKDMTTRKLFSTLLSRFQMVGFREDSAVTLSNKYFGVKSEWVLDPVFLLEKDNFSNIANQSNLNIDYPYLVAYILDPTDEKIHLIEQATRTLGIKRHIIVDSEHFTKRREFFGNDPTVENKIPFEDFLYLFFNANYIITDSFHGTCFAIIFNKKYISIKRGNKKRFDSLSNLLGYQDKSYYINIFDSVEEALNNGLTFPPLDFKSFNNIIRVKKEFCLKLLKDSLSIDMSSVQNDDHESLVSLAREWKSKSNYFKSFWDQVLKDKSLPKDIYKSKSLFNNYIQFFIKGLPEKIHYELLFFDNNIVKLCLHIEDKSLLVNDFKKYLDYLINYYGFLASKKGIEKNAVKMNAFVILSILLIILKLK